MTDRPALRPIVGSLAALAMMLAATQGAGADGRDWAPALTAQIFDVHQCVVAFLTQVVEREVDGRPVVIAKAHCEDDRAFDVYREGRLSRFEFTECEVPDQEAC